MVPLNDMTHDSITTLDADETVTATPSSITTSPSIPLAPSDVWILRVSVDMMNDDPLEIVTAEDAVEETENHHPMFTPAAPPTVNVFSRENMVLLSSSSTVSNATYTTAACCGELPASRAGIVVVSTMFLLIVQTENDDKWRAVETSGPNATAYISWAPSVTVFSVMVTCEASSKRKPSVK